MGWDALPPGHVGWRQGGGEWRGKVAERWYAPWAGGEAGGIRLKPSELHLCSLYTAERKWVERCAAGARVKCRWGCRWDLLAREAGGGHAWCPDAHAARVLQRPPCTLCAHTCLPLRTQVFARSSEGGARRAPAHCYAPKGCSAQETTLAIVMALQARHPPCAARAPPPPAAPWAHMTGTPAAGWAPGCPPSAPRCVPPSWRPRAAASARARVQGGWAPLLGGVPMGEAHEGGGVG